MHANISCRNTRSCRFSRPGPDTPDDPATESVLQVTIDEFQEDWELKIKFARILDLLAGDQDDMATTAVETATHLTDFEAVKVGDLLCDFYSDLE